MSTVLVTGGTGFVGSRLVKRLLAAGRHVRVLAVANDPLLGNLAGFDCDVVTGDITRPETLGGPLAGVDAVVHLAAVLYADDPALFRRVNLEGTARLVDAAVAAGVGHFVYVSAAAAGYRVRTTYGETKYLAEQLMQAPRGRTNFTLVRPTLVFGPGGGGQELVMYVERIRAAGRFVPIVGRGAARKRWVHIDDLVEGLALVVGRPIAYGRTYNLGGADAHTMRGYTEMIRRRLGVAGPVVPVPLWLCWGLAGVLHLLGRRPLLKRDTIVGVTMDADVDIEPARREISYAPVAFEEWLFSATAGDPFWEPGRRTTPHASG
jgi:nucleoside-diphosphate-sugar epimerase